MGSLAKDFRTMAKAYNDTKLEEAISYYRSSNILDIVLEGLRESAADGSFFEEVHLRNTKYKAHEDAIARHRDVFINLVSHDLRKRGFHTTICFTTPARQMRYIAVSWRIPRRWWHSCLGS